METQENLLRITENTCPSFYSFLIRDYVNQEYIDLKKELVTLVINFKDYIFSERSTGFICNYLTRDPQTYNKAERYLVSYELDDAIKTVESFSLCNQQAFLWFLRDSATTMLKICSLSKHNQVGFELTVPHVIVKDQEPYTLTFDLAQDLAECKKYPYRVIRKLSCVDFGSKLKTDTEFRNRFIRQLQADLTRNTDGLIIEDRLMKHFLENTDRKSEIICKAFLYAYLSMNKLNCILDTYHN